MEESNRVDERRLQIAGYQYRASQFLQNANNVIKKGELAKASEFLWGAMASYLNALTLLQKGKADEKHGELVARGKEVASVLGDKRLFKAIDSVGNELHANFYHGFISSDSFPDYYEEALYAIETLDKLLRTELSTASPDS